MSAGVSPPAVQWKGLGTRPGRDNDSNPVLTQINELLRKAMAASVAVKSAVWDGEVRCDPYDAVRYAVSAKLDSGTGWAAEGYESKIRGGPGGAQSV